MTRYGLNGAAPNPPQVQTLRRVRVCAPRGPLLAVALLVGSFALVAGPVSADDRYSLSPAPQADGFAGVGPAVSVSRGEAEADREDASPYRLSVRSTGDAPALDATDNAFASPRLFEAVGGYHQDLGGGFGYGLNLGFGMETRPEWNDLGPTSESTSYFTDFSFGPTFATGRFDSQFRVGVRQPLSSDDRGMGFGYGDRNRDISRTAGYLSLDGRLRLQNQSELSLSLYYDDYSLNSADDWLADRLEFDGASRDPASSVIGVEMGLTF
ncbi:hypothetical protein [Thioalkalivibrio sp. AKL19]|uniref:hypothetical protein n=1 Tax=Thioalkalivibrio sp. AKL19 TaxID=1266914 RepID=UPI0003F5E70E|nr:hypothetical protein [Thioalkalivibrio sp. AKL19]